MRLFILALCLALSAVSAQARGASGAPTWCAGLTVTYGTAFKYNSGYPAKYVGSDIWFNTWAAISSSTYGNIAASNDSLWGWAGNNSSGSNFAVSQLSTTDTTTTGTSVNIMAPWGTVSQSDTGAPSDGFSFKAGGIISISGVWYIAVNRATNTTPGAPYQYMLQNMQLIKSTNYGVSWTPQPPTTAAHYTSPMFTGYQNGNADFLQYGQDYVGQTADNSSVYVYAYGTEGPYNNANNVYLARVKIANIGNQAASDWTYYQGGDGMLDASWSSTWPPQPLMTGNKVFGASVGTQYFASLGCYVRINWWYPTVTAGSGLTTTTSIWQPWAAPHPWGPWTVVGPQTAWNSEPGVGLFSPHIMPASLAAGSGNTVTAVALSAGDYNSQSQSTGDYTMTMVPITVSHY